MLLPHTEEGAVDEHKVRLETVMLEALSISKMVGTLILLHFINTGESQY